MGAQDGARAGGGTVLGSQSQGLLWEMFFRRPWLQTHALQSKADSWARYLFLLLWGPLIFVFPPKTAQKFLAC